MLKAFKYRMYPTDLQKVVLEKHFGAVRLLYNLALDVKTYAHKSHGINVGYHELATKQLTELKKCFPFLKEVNSQSLQGSLRNLDAAYDKFFKRLSGFPKFKRKGGRESFFVPQNFFIEDRKLNIPKFREGIKIELHRPTKGVHKSVTISRTASGKYFASILCNTGNVDPIKKPITAETAVGIDMGLKDFVYCSDGFHVAAPQYLRTSEEHLAWMQRQFSRKKRGSNRAKIWKNRIAKQHEIIANQRKDFLHKLSAEITNRYDTLCFETLNIRGMSANHCLAKSIGDAGWAMFKGFCEYKSAWKGGNVLSIGTFEPSSKECAHCGHIKKDLQLSEREWDCPNCGAHLHRDKNAADVIKKKSLRVAERALEDVEVSPLSARKCLKKRAYDASKVQNNVMEFLS